MILRPMKMDDADFMLSLKNDPDTRKYAILTSDEIKREDHIKFLEKNIDQFQVIMMGNNTAIGAIRIQNNEISIWILKEHRNKMCAHYTLMEASKTGMTAKIVVSNIASLRLFLKNGFKPIVYNEDYNYYILQKP